MDDPQVKQDIDERQQAELDQLKEAADDNKSTDRSQWIMLAVVGIALFLYTGAVLGGAIISQGGTIRSLAERCK